MGITIELQDDTGLAPQAAFHNDAKGLAYALVELAIIATLEQQLGLDLAPLRLAAYNWETTIKFKAATVDALAMPDPVRDGKLQEQFRELRAELDALWQPPDELRQAIQRLLGALEPLSPEQLALIVEAVPAQPTQRNFIEHYLGEGGLIQDLSDLLVMLRWSELRGATRVRLVAS